MTQSQYVEFELSIQYFNELFIIIWIDDNYREKLFPRKIWFYLLKFEIFEKYKGTAI